MKYYVGHPLQTRGAEHYVLQGGKGDGMHFLQLRNGCGLEVWVSLDRCGDPNRVTYKGMNMSYMSPCGNVAPAYFDKEGGFLRSFTAGFMTTCGFEGAGGPCIDEGEAVPQHGTAGNLPALLDAVLEDEEGLTVLLTVRDCVLFGRRFVLKRKYFLSYTENYFTVSDDVANEGEAIHPFTLLYHCNMGYPLVSEKADVRFPNTKIWANDQLAISDMDNAFKMEEPQQGYTERCYFFDAKVHADDLVHNGIWNPDISAGMIMTYDKKELPCLTEWKMMGRRDYVLGIEPGNVCPSPRIKMREQGVLPFLEADSSYKTNLKFSFVDKYEDFDKVF